MFKDMLIASLLKLLEASVVKKCEVGIVPYLIRLNNGCCRIQQVSSWEQFIVIFLAADIFYSPDWESIVTIVDFIRGRQLSLPPPNGFQEAPGDLLNLAQG